jgi:hypothetical protein
MMGRQTDDQGHLFYDFWQPVSPPLVCGTRTGAPDPGPAASQCPPGHHVVGIQVTGNSQGPSCLGCLNNLQVVCSPDPK